MHILIVDDDAMVADLIALFVEMIGQSTIFLAANAALQDFQPGKYDIALLDLGLPDLPGNELAKNLKQIDPGLPCVCITGFPLHNSDPIAAIFDAVVLKPFGVEILDAIERFARDRED